MTVSKHIRQIICPTLLLLGAETASARPEATFELLHLWAEDAEQHALSAFSEPMQAAGVEWSEHIVRTNFEGVRKTYADRVAQGVAPSATFWIGGGPAVVELVEEEVFREIVDETNTASFAERLLPEIHEAVRHGEGISVLPVGIHIQNHIVYNRNVLDEIGGSRPASWDDFLHLAERASQAGYFGISISDQAWQLRFLMGSFMAEHLSPEEMKALASNEALGLPQRTAIREAFAKLDKLRHYINPDFRNLDWADAVGHVVEGRALANSLGDFVAPLVQSQRDFVCALPPGNRYVTWSFDSIALSKTTDPPEIKGQNLFIETIFDPHNAARYISRKGGVPVVSEFDIDSLSGCAKASVEAWRGTRDHVRMTGREWTRSMALISSHAHDFLGNPELELDPIVDDLLETLEMLKALERGETVE